MHFRTYYSTPVNINGIIWVTVYPPELHVALQSELVTMDSGVIKLGCISIDSKVFSKGKYNTRKKKVLENKFLPSGTHPCHRLLGRNRKGIFTRVDSSETSAWGNEALLLWPQNITGVASDCPGALVGSSICWLLTRTRFAILVTSRPKA